MFAYIGIGIGILELLVIAAVCVGLPVAAVLIVMLIVPSQRKPGHDRSDRGGDDSPS